MEADANGQRDVFPVGGVHGKDLDDKKIGILEVCQQAKIKDDGEDKQPRGGDASARAVYRDFMERPADAVIDEDGKQEKEDKVLFAVKIKEQACRKEEEVAEKCAVGGGN